MTMQANAPTGTRPTSTDPRDDRWPLPIGRVRVTPTENPDLYLRMEMS